MTLDGMRCRWPIAEKPQVIFLAEADLRANRPGRTPAMGVVHQAYENPFPVSIATDRDADAPRGATAGCDRQGRSTVAEWRNQTAAPELMFVALRGHS